MPDKLTDNEIVKAKELIKMLREAYNAYYDTSKGMPYNIDETLRESAFCLENCLNEINRLKAENERLNKHINLVSILYEEEQEQNKEIKAEAYKEFAERLDNEFKGIAMCNHGWVKNKIKLVLKELAGD